MTWPLAANLSMLFTAQPLPDRIAAAAEAGFDGVEIQFPYELEADMLDALLERSAMPLALINVPAGDLMTGGPGLAGVPARAAEFGQALDVALRYAERARPGCVNILPGRLAEGVELEAALDCLVANLQLACPAFEALGIRVTFEAINRHDMPGFLIATPADQLLIMERVGHANLSAQLDLYHMARMGLALTEAIHDLGSHIGHVQFADAPGRGKPGSGTIDFPAAFAALRQVGYRGWLAAEYRADANAEAGEEQAWLQAWSQESWIRRRDRSA